MATITKADKVTENKTDLDTTAPAVGIEKPVESTEFKLDNEEVRRVMARIRYRLQESVRDANRRVPIMSETKEIAADKANAVFTVLKEFSDQSL